MARNRYYNSAHWLKLRAMVLERDGYSCTVKGCDARATHVDHIKTRPPHADGPTPFDVAGNLRSLCATHDAQVKERRTGRRGNSGRFRVEGCDADGVPLDPSHHWR